MSRKVLLKMFGFLGCLALVLAACAYDQNDDFFAFSDTYALTVTEP